MFDHSLDIFDQPWFYGSISRNDCDNYLIEEGDFLIRVSHI